MVALQHAFNDVGICLLLVKNIANYFIGSFAGRAD